MGELDEARPIRRFEPPRKRGKDGSDQFDA